MSSTRPMETDELDDPVIKLADAAISGNKAEFDALLEKKVDVNARTTWFHRPITPLMRAIQNSSMVAVNMLLDAKADPNVRGGYNGRNALMEVSSQKDDFDILERLLKAGVDINAKDDSGCSALLMACTSSAHIDVVQKINALIKAKADVTTKNKNDSTALHLVLNSEAIASLVKAKADINAQDDTRSTPLMDASKYETCGPINEEHTSLSHAKKLIEMKADLYLKDKDGQTALDMASGPEMRALILEAMPRQKASATEASSPKPSYLSVLLRSIKHADATSLEPKSPKPESPKPESTEALHATLKKIR